MSLTYNVLLQDDFDWNYANANRKKVLKNIQADFLALNRDEPKLLAEWHGFMVLSCGKTPVYIDQYKNVILNQCDSAYYYSNEEPYDLIKL